MRITAQVTDDGGIRLASESGLSITIDSADDALNLAVGLITAAQEAQR